MEEILNEINFKITELEGRGILPHILIIPHKIFTEMLASNDTLPVGTCDLSGNKVMGLNLHRYSGNEIVVA